MNFFGGKRVKSFSSGKKTSLHKDGVRKYSSTFEKRKWSLAEEGLLLRG